MSDEKRVFEGPGSIRVSSIPGGNSSPSQSLALIRVGEKWFFAKFLAENIIAEGSSVVQIMRQVLRGNLTTKRICDLLKMFNLTLEDLVKDDPGSTSAFISQICSDLLAWAAKRNEMPQKSIEHLQVLLNGLNAEAPSKMREILQGTIRNLESIGTIKLEDLDEDKTPGV